MYTLFLDTDCDFTKEEAEKNGFRLISMPYAIDGETVFPYESFDTFDSHPFYDRLREGVIPSTFSISEEKYYDYFLPEFSSGKDILYAHFSTVMSQTFDNMQRAVDRLQKEFPERKFYSVDLKGITVLGYNLGTEVLKMYKANKTPEEIVAWAETEVYHFTQYFFSDDLKFLHKSGRVGNVSATMGSLIGIRPLIGFTDEGKMVSVGTVKGRTRAIEKLVSYMEELGDHVPFYQVVIGHTDAPEIVDELVALLQDRFGELKIKIIPTNPTSGSHCGPNGVGISFHSIHR